MCLSYAMYEHHEHMCILEQVRLIVVIRVLFLSRSYNPKWHQYIYIYMYIKAKIIQKTKK